jgi:hypothetical protein
VASAAFQLSAGSTGPPFALAPLQRNYLQFTHQAAQRDRVGVVFRKRPWQMTVFRGFPSGSAACPLISPRIVRPMPALSGAVSGTRVSGEAVMLHLRSDRRSDGGPDPTYASLVSGLAMRPPPW